MSASDLKQIIGEYHAAVDDFATGDPKPVKKLWSRREDVTLANPLGPPVRGWSEVEATLDRAASQVHEGEPARYDIISEYATGDLAYNVVMQHTRAKFGSASDIQAISLRVTTIFRREPDGWRVVHRHADPISEPRPVESVLRK